MERVHRTLLLAEVIEFLKVNEAGVYLDGTFGEGGHTEAILEKGGRVVGLDRDLSALTRYRESGNFRADSRLSLQHGRMSQVGELFPARAFQGAIVDLGVSTRQILSTERGFSFQGEGPLDMRMDESDPRTLEKVLSSLSERELADALYQYADVPGARRIASRLITDFRKGLIRNTADVAALAGPSHGKRHPATQLFMALRMLVNEELWEIEQGIPAIFDRLAPGGRLCVITFHSVEDRVVKWIFKRLAGQCVCGTDPCLCDRVKQAELLTKKPVLPSREEERSNPRARSAKLRCIEKIST